MTIPGDPVTGVTASPLAVATSDGLNEGIGVKVKLPAIIGFWVSWTDETGCGSVPT